MDTATDASEINGEIVRLKNELSRTKKALTDQIIKRHRSAAELSLKVDQKTDQLKDFHRSNFDDLGRVLRSLYVFESKLRKEQRQIRRELGERDSLIRRQQLEIAKLRQTLVSRCRANDAHEDVDEAAASAVPVSKPDLITSILPRPTSNCGENVVPAKHDEADSSRGEKIVVVPPTSDGARRLALPVEERVATKKTATNNNINFNKNVYSKTVTDLSLNDISSFPNPTPNNNLFVVSNSIFSKNEFTHNAVSKEATMSIKQNGKVITSALKKPDKYPSSKSVHFGKTTHIPEPDEDGQTDIVKTVETLLLQQCGDSTESENDTSSTASTETSPSVSQMVRKFESICTIAVPATVTTVGVDSKGSSSASSSPSSSRSSSSSSPVQYDCCRDQLRRRPNRVQYPKYGNSSYIAEDELKTAAELLTADDTIAELSDPCGSDVVTVVPPGDLDHPRNNFEEFRFEDSDLLDRDHEEYCRADGDGLECCRPDAASPSNDCPETDPGGGGGGPINYESFLEVTGLSQKSIITVQSNRNAYGSHRNVQKPKDVKSRSRAKSVSFEYKPYPSTVKYWTEPFL